MTGEEADCLAVRFVLDLVDRLGREHGFDPADLVSLRTGAPLGPFITRMRREVQLYERSHWSANGSRGRPHPRTGACR